MGTPTLCQQQFDGARVALGGCQHQRGATLLLMDLDVCILLQQQLHNLEMGDKRRGQERLNDEHPGGGALMSRLRLTCVWPCLVALSSGAIPLRLGISSPAPRSRRKAHTSVLPLPAAALSTDRRSAYG